MPPAAQVHPAEDAASDPSSFDQVYRAHARTVARWAEHLGGPGADHDSIVQEVFLTVSRRLPEFRGDAKLTTWLFRITARIAANHRRGVRRRRVWARLTNAIAEVVTSAGPAPGDALEERQAARQFHRVLDGLAENYRQVLILFEVEELSTEEIARVLERPPATIRVWLHRARAQFSKLWAAEERKEESP